MKKEKEETNNRRVITLSIAKGNVINYDINHNESSYFEAYGILRNFLVYLEKIVDSREEATDNPNVIYEYVG
jgi:hypothetical protein